VDRDEGIGDAAEVGAAETLALRTEPDHTAARQGGGLYGRHFDRRCELGV
jgi:hypothetical protein